MAAGSPRPGRRSSTTTTSIGRGRASRRSRQEDLAFWRRRLEPPPEELRLPFETPAGEGGTACGRLISRRLSAAVAEGVRRLAAAAGGTPFTAYAFAFRLLLERYLDGRRIGFATPVSTRSHPATARMIGYFSNPVVIATPIDEELPVAVAVGEFGRRLRECLAHAAVPFQTLAEDLSPPRRPDRHPLFQVMFVHQEIDAPPELGNARLEPVALDLGESKFDLTLFVNEGPGSLEIAVEYRVDRFAAVWMERLLGHYETLLAQLPADPGCATAAVRMLDEEERQTLAAAARGAEPDAAGFGLLPARILEQCQVEPRSPAVVCGGVGHSHGELASAGRAIADELLAAGVEPGGRVGLYLDRSVRMIAGILGSHWAGAAYVPLDPAYPQARNRLVLEDADVAAVLTTGDRRAALPAGPWPVIDVARLDSGAEAAAAPAELSPEDVAYILYTSGSTGRPKGVVVTHGNLSASTGARLQVYGEPPKRFLLVPSIAFDSSVAGIFWTLATASTLVMPTDEEARDPRQLARLVARERVSCLLCVPSLYGAMLEAGGDELQGLEAAIVAGESCSSGLVEEHYRRLPRVGLFNEYGPTEATVWATVHEITADDAARPVAIGRPIPGVRVDVLDGRGRPVPVGVPGQAWIAGPTVARGYWRRPELSAERFVTDAMATTPERRYRTGDRVAWTADGRLLFLGREDEQIKLRGFRIEPGEVEAALLGLPGVEQAAVVARSAGSGLGSGALTGAGSQTAQLVGFVEGAPIAGNWRQELARRLPEHMIPSRIVALPETAAAAQRQDRSPAAAPDAPGARGRIARARRRRAEPAAEHRRASLDLAVGGSSGALGSRP